MTTKAQLRKSALALPDVEEITQVGLLAYKVSGKIFASLTEDGVVQLVLSTERAKRVLTSLPAAAMATSAGDPVGVRVALADINGMELNSLLNKAWLSHAPKSLTQPLLSAASGEAPAGPNALPKSIGKPATRALLAAGVKSLSDVAERTEAELASLHGVGPRAIRLLGEALAERGLSFGPGRP